MNTLAVIYILLYKGKREGRQIEIASQSEIVEAAERNLKSAEISNQMLIDRINDLKSELDAERDARQAEVQAEREARQKEVEYLRRRLAEYDREVRDLKNWAAQLMKQVLEAGKIPAAYLPSLEDSDPALRPVRKESNKPKDEK